SRTVWLSRRTGEGGDVVAAVSARAAALRLLRVGDVDLVEPTTRTTDPPGMAGAVLVPWPNRVADATWQHRGHEQHLDVTEPELGHALHGLLARSDLVVETVASGSVTMRAEIRSPAGYPFDLDVLVRYELLDDGASTTIAVHNVGTDSAPVAIGGHPYLRVGATPTSELRIDLDIDHEWPLDERNIPVGRVERPGGIRSRGVDDGPRHATYELEAAGTQVVHAATAPSGRRVELVADAEFRYTQLWVAPALDTDDGPREAIAVEPMTAPPNALRTGTGVTWVGPGSSWSAAWLIRLADEGPDSPVGPTPAGRAHTADTDVHHRTGTTTDRPPEHEGTT
ncbi:MAG: hypothetical protein ACTMKU_04765, partial [Actinomycetaceae bacterium]